MSDTLPLKATFEAFKKHERSGVLTQASVAYLLITFIVFGLFVWMNLPAFGEIFAWYGQVFQAAGYGGAPPEPPMAMLRIIPGYILLMLAVFVLLASYEAACLRWLVRGETDGVLGLTLGPDTWRIYAGYWVWFGLYLGFYLASVIVIAIVAGVLSTGGDATLTGIVVSILALVIFCAAIYFMVRLAPAAATSVAQGRFSFFKAWTVTRGRFGALFGSFLVLILLYFVGVIVLYIVAAALFGVMMAPMLMQSGGTVAPQQIAAAMSGAFSSPNGVITLLAVYALYFVLATTLYVGFFGVNARAVLVAREEGKLPS
jgi:hypothetical protein